MILNNISSLEEYIKYLKGQVNEIDVLCNDLLIRVTSFFRDPEVFEVLRKKIFPTVVQNKKNNKTESSIRLWIPGCATGEEAYSYSIIMLECLSDISYEGELQIFATDISEKAIEKARDGKYPKSIEADISPERLKRYFVKTGDGYQICKLIRDLCVFAVQDLTIDPPFSRMDIISCRNLLIYLDPLLQKKVFTSLHYGLNPNGFLILGTSEGPGKFSNYFDVIDKKNKIFSKKINIKNKHSIIPSPDFKIRGANQVDKLEKKNAIYDEKEIVRRADNIILNHLAPVGVIIDSNLDILQIRGDATNYLVPPAGPPSYNILKMARPKLRTAIRTLTTNVKKNKHVESRDGICMKLNNHMFNTKIIVFPFQAFERDFFVVGLIEEPLLDDGKTKTKKIDEDTKQILLQKDDEIKQLDRELSEIRDQLLATEEEFESTTEELKSSSEEILSSNEELQSSNEELQTAKEEVQSTNEELRTLNEELENRNLELGQINDDLNNLLDSIRIPVVMLGVDLCIRRFNPTSQKIFRLIPADVGRSILDVNSNFDLPYLKQLIYEVIDKNLSTAKDIQDNHGLWYSLEITPYKTGDNKIAGAVLAFFDITKRKKEEELLRLIIEGTPRAMIVFDKKQNIILLNKFAGKIFSYKEEELINNSVGNLISLNDRVKFNEVLISLINKYEQTNGNENNAVEVEDINGIRSDGSEIPLEIGLNSIQISGEIYLISSINDISERKKSEDRNRAIIESAPFATIVFDHSGKIVQVNTEAEKLLGYNRDELLGKNQEIIMPERFKTKLSAHINSFILSPVRNEMGPFKEQVMARRKNGSEFSSSIDLSPVVTKDGIIVTCSIRDITKQLKKEKQLLREKTKADNANLQKSAFLANMGHEIRTPLTAIIGFAELLEHRPGLDIAKRDSYLQTIKRNGNHLSQLIDELLDLSKIEAGAMKLEKVKINLEDEINCVVRPLRLKAKSSGLDFNVLFETEVPDFIISDPKRIRQILYNLIGNSIKFTNTGYIHLEIKYEHKNSMLYFTIKDSGCGISSEFHSLIFKPFSQGDNSTTRKYGGTGLGLSLSRKLARLLGGDLILVQSGLNKGSTFQVYFPVEVYKEVRFISPNVYMNEQNKEPFLSLNGRINGANILIVEDGIDNQKLFRDILEYAGAKIKIIKNGKAAIEEAQSNKYDVILMDIQIPLIDGHQVTSILRENGYKGPIIALTAHAMKEEKDLCIEAGCNDYRSKPISAEELIKVVEKWLHYGKD